MKSTGTRISGLSFKLALQNTDEDREELSHYQRILNPGDARFYSTFADVEMQKLPLHIGYNCDACKRELIKSRSMVCSELEEKLKAANSGVFACRQSLRSAHCGPACNPSPILTESSGELLRKVSWGWITLYLLLLDKYHPFDFIPSHTKSKPEFTASLNQFQWNAAPRNAKETVAIAGIQQIVLNFGMR
ncbi:hypothetical protein DL96DRAFT_1757504 [Flagelloscypha sp. PMI_526]|nr:hypothetical protein DL96DRAFT_1757504 [Flagelloscypha sp. PMI_526]